MTDHDTMEKFMNQAGLETERKNCLQILSKYKAAKHHTIRAGHRFKAGDKFSPRVWSGKAYRSKQIIIAPDIEVMKTFDFHIRKNDYFINHSPVNYNQLKVVAANDGLEIDDFECWFNVKKGEVFAGQIICWNENINY